MKRRKIDAETKMAAVLEGLKGESSCGHLPQVSNQRESVISLAGQVLGRWKQGIEFPERFWARGCRKGQDF
jgi:hypothetical protein